VRKPWQNRSSEGKRLVGRALQARNLRIKTRDQYTCRACGRLTEDGEVDHRIPLSQGGSDRDDNLQWLCRTPCHEVKSLREQGGQLKQGCNTSGEPVDPLHPWNA